ncbi:DNA primase family protein [Symmachiella dynata]|nr:phage/plasmid primase, P4 family [Symmachiella dynata]
MKRPREADPYKAKLPEIAYVHGQTDSAHATRFVDQYQQEVLYVPPWKRWLSWDGTRWVDDSGVGVLQRAKRYSKALWAEVVKIAPHLDRDDLAKVVTAIKQANQASKIRSFLELAAVDERIVCQVDELNADPKLLNVPNGTVDLETGELRPHNPADRITQLANVAYDPSAKCPNWERMLSLVFNKDDDVIRYVQRLLGYSLSGDTGEHILPIAWGKGCNGKSTIWNVVTDLLGEYATLANDDLLLGEKTNHPTEKAALYQKRFVAISEPEHNSSLREARVKELTGDRTITARRMKEDFWSFERSHTFWLSTNHLPRINGTDDGIWRRVKLIPFTVDLRKVVDPIPDYDVWLVQNEGRGILAWLVRGFLEYRKVGLQEPQTVTEATGRYRDDSDPLGDFLAEHCVEESGAVGVASELYHTYSESGGKWSSTAFGRAMAERYTKTKETSGPNRNKNVYLGVRLRDDFEDFDQTTPGGDH